MNSVQPFDYLPKANRVASQIPQVLQNRGLPPVFKGFKLAPSSTKGVWLFAVLDEDRIEKIERYTNPEVTHQISTALGGLPVVVSNSTGLRYGVLLSEKPELPKSVDFPGVRSGLIQVGRTIQGEAVSTFEEFGNCIVAGVTRYGKSNFLRLITAQALAGGHQVALIDPQGDTFPYELSSNPQVIANATTLSGARDALDKVVEEYLERNRLTIQARESGQARPVFPRLFVLMDEFNGLLRNNGGPKGEFAQRVFELAFGALKYGIHLVIGGHEFTTEEVGPIAGQMFTRVCFKVMRPSIGKVVVDRRDLAGIETKGRAYTRPWGWVQVYRMDESELLANLGPSVTGGPQQLGDGLTDRERALREFILAQHQGRMTFEALQSQGLSRTQAVKVRQEWVARGLARPEPQENNSIVLVGRESIKSSG